MKKGSIFVAILMVVTMLLIGCATPAAPSPGQATPATQSTVPMQTQASTTPKSPSPATDVAAGTGKLEVRVTDPPPPKMDHVWVKVANLEVHKDGGAWATITGQADPFDLKAIEGIEQFLASKLVEPGKYTQIRLDATVTIEVGKDKFEAKVPSSKIKLVGNFEVIKDKTTVITLDFDGEKSVNVSGKDEYIFKPVIRLLVAGKPVGLGITTVSLPNGAVETVYSAKVEASGGTEPYKWSVSSGSLPAGLTLDSVTGAISGTPTAAGTSNFTVKVEDASSPVQSITKSFDVEIAAKNMLVITTTSLADGEKDKAYTATVEAIGGIKPYKWSISAGVLPDGLNLNADTGVISGTPTKKGDFSFTVQVKDSPATPQIDTQALKIIIE